MAYNEVLANRLRALLEDVPKVEEKPMFSGLTFMVDDKMCIGVSKDRIMCRIDPVLHDEVVEKTGVITVEMGNRSYKGYVYVDAESVKTPKQLQYWVDLCLEFNKRAKSSKKKKK